MLAELARRLAQDFVLIVRIVPDRPVQIDPNMLSGDIRHDPGRQLDVSRFDDEYETGFQMGGPEGPQSDGLALRKQVLDPERRAWRLRDAHRLAGDAKVVAEHVGDEMCGVLILWASVIVSADLADRLSDESIELLLRDHERFAGARSL